MSERPPKIEEKFSGICQPHNGTTDDIQPSSDVRNETTKPKFKASSVKLSGIGNPCINAIGSSSTAHADGLGLIDTNGRNSHTQLAAIDSVSRLNCNLDQDCSAFWFPPLEDMGNQQGSEGGKKSPEGGKKKDHRKKESPKSSKKSNKQSPPGATSSSRSATGSSKSKTLPAGGKSSTKPLTGVDRLTVKAAGGRGRNDSQQQSMTPSAALVTPDQPLVPDVYTDAVDNANDLIANVNLDTDRQASESSSDDDNISFESVSCATPLRTASPNVQRVKQATGGTAVVNNPVDRVEELGKSIERTIIERFSGTSATTGERPEHLADKPVPEETKLAGKAEPKQHDIQSASDRQKQELTSPQTPTLSVQSPSQPEMKNTPAPQQEFQQAKTKPAETALKPPSNVRGNPVETTEASVVKTQEETEPSWQTDQTSIPESSGPSSQTENVTKPEERTLPSQTLTLQLSTDTEPAQSIKTELQPKVRENTLPTKPEGSHKTEQQIVLVEHETEVQHKYQQAQSDIQAVSELNLQQTHSGGMSQNKPQTEQTECEIETKPKQDTRQKSVTQTQQETAAVQCEIVSQREEKIKQTKSKTVSHTKQETEQLKSHPVPRHVQGTEQTNSEVLPQTEQHTEQLKCKSVLEAEQNIELTISEKEPRPAPRTEPAKSEGLSPPEPKLVKPESKSNSESQQISEPTASRTMSQPVLETGAIKTEILSQPEQKTEKTKTVSHNGLTVEQTPSGSESEIKQETMPQPGQQQFPIQGALPRDTVCVPESEKHMLLSGSQHEQHAVPPKSLPSPKSEVEPTPSGSSAQSEPILVQEISEMMPHAIPKSGLLKTDDTRSDSEPLSKKPALQTKSPIHVDDINPSATCEPSNELELDLDHSSIDFSLPQSQITDLFIVENNEELANASASSDKQSILSECKEEAPNVDIARGVDIISVDRAPVQKDSTKLDNRKSESSTPTSPLPRLENPLVESLVMLIKQTMESDSVDETNEGAGSNESHRGKDVMQKKSDDDPESIMKNCEGLTANEVTEPDILGTPSAPGEIPVEKGGDGTVAADDTGCLNIDEDTEKTLTPDDMVEFEQLKRRAMKTGSLGDGDDNIEDEDDDTLTQADLVEFDRLKRKIMGGDKENVRTEYPINSGEDLSFPLHIVDKFDLSSGETTEDSVIERPVVKMEPVLASTLEEESSHDGASVDGDEPSVKNQGGSLNPAAQKIDVKPTFSTVAESPQLKRRSLTEDEIKQQIRKFMIPEIKEALPKVGSMNQMLEELHDITPTSDQTPDTGDRDDMTSPDHPTGSGLHSRTSITSSELDMSEQRDDVSTDADDEDDSASEVLFCKTYTEPERGSEVLVSCTVVNSALKWEEGGSSDEFWAESSAAEDAYRQVELSADAANRHFSHARSQMHDIQQHLQALRYQMQAMEKQVVNTSLPSTDEFCFDDPERRAITD